MRDDARLKHIAKIMPESCQKGAKRGAKRLSKLIVLSKNWYKKRFKYTLRFMDFGANFKERIAETNIAGSYS